MLRILVPILIISSLPWAALTWWRIKRAHSEAEREFIRRTHIGVAIFTVLAVLSLGALGAREKLFALPILGTVWMGIRHGIRKGRERLQAEEGDHFRRMKRVN